MEIVNSINMKTNLLDKKKIKIVIIIAMIPLAIFLWPSFIGGTTDFFTVSGNSMLPTILPGSFVITKQQSTYSIDDIVAFYLRAGGSQKIVVHRIIDDTDDRGFRIQGDNNGKPDTGFFKTERIIGKVAITIPHAGYMLSLMKNPIVLVVLSIVTIVIQMEMKKRKKKKTGRGIHQESVYSTPMSFSIQKPKLKTTDYRLFFIVNGLNITVYIMQQIAIINESQIGGDIISSVLYSVLDNSVASTITFSLYFLLFVGLYIYAKRAENIQPFIVPTYHAHRYTFTNTRIKKVQTVWVIFSLLLGWHMLSIVGVL